METLFSFFTVAAIANIDMILKGVLSERIVDTRRILKRKTQTISIAGCGSIESIEVFIV